MLNLQKLISRDPRASSVVTTLLTAPGPPVGVYDAAGNLLAGSGSPLPGAKYELVAGDELIGWVTGEENASVVAQIISYTIERELEKKALAREALDRYRELNLIYDVSEKIGASLEVGAVAGVAINEARRLIKRGMGVVLVLDEETGLMSPLEIEGGDQPDDRSLRGPGIRLGEGLIGTIVANGRPEVVTDVAADPRSGGSPPGAADGAGWEPGSGVRSLICAPLVSKQRVIGAFMICSAELVDYTASDLKLLSAIASLAAPAIDNALLYEKTVRESQERERRLQQQLAELRIEVDQARQARQVAQITGTDYFKTLREQATSLREQLDRG